MRWSFKRPGRRAGIAVTYVAFAGMVFVGFATFAVDVGYVSLVKSELKASVDAATLAASSGLSGGPAEARKRAKDIAKANLVDGKPLVLQDSDIEFGVWDPATGAFTKYTGTNESKASAVRVNGHLSKARGNQINMIFAPVVGLKTLERSSSAIAGFGQAADVVIVQDITSSFADELADAKEGDQALLDSLYQGGAGRSSVGIVAHTGWGKTISPLRNVSTYYSTLTSAVTSLKHCGSTGMPVCSGTDIAAGLEQGIKVFNDPVYPSTSPTGKVIVLVSDGTPSQAANGSHPTSNATQLLTLAQQQADIAWSQGIHVYVVFFNRDKDASAAAKVATLKRGKGDFVEVTKGKDLPDALEGITKKLPMQLVR